MTTLFCLIQADKLLTRRSHDKNPHTGNFMTTAGPSSASCPVSGLSGTGS
jgi:hypothetical protein